MRARRWLVAFEVLCLVAWAALAVGFVASKQDEEGPARLDVAALATGPAEERWNGIFYQESHVGYSVSRVSPALEGGTLYEGRSQLSLATFGKLQRIVTASAALVDRDGALRSFDFFLASDQVRLSARGEVRGDEIIIDVSQAGETRQINFPITRPPQVSLSLESAIRRTPLAVGGRFTVPYFDPVTLAEGEMEFRVTDVTVLENGEEAYWLETRFHDVLARALVLPTGETIRQEGALGLSIVRMTEAEAKAIPANQEPVDLIALSAVKLKGNLPRARELRQLTVRVSGVELSKLPSWGPLQSRDGDLVQVDVPLWEELPHLPVTDPSEPAWLEATMTLPTQHPEIVEQAALIVGDAPDRLEAVRRLNTWVYRNVDKVPVMGVPNGLEVLRARQGDCNEHTALFVSLARAAGIPARIAAGVVYSDRVTDRGAFYYHAWPEVRLGGPTDWVPVDPTFGQAPADATHIKLVEGDLDRQVEIMGYLGKLGLEVVDAR